MLLVSYIQQYFNPFFNPKKTGGGGGGLFPLDISRDYSATLQALAATLYDFFFRASRTFCPGGLLHPQM